MKIRNGFVSNSSSSSFICNVCGQDESGYDMGLEEAEMYECENRHTFCVTHAINMDDVDIEDHYEIPSKYCPICQMEHVTDEDMVKFLLTKNGLTSDDVKTEIQSKFKSYKDLVNYSK